jgi:hypothetical protein
MTSRKKQSTESAVREIRRYAKLGDEALVSVLRPTSTEPSDATDLSRACPADDSPSPNYLNLKGEMASPTGLE